MKNGLEVNQYGVKSWRLNGLYHKYGEPAVIWPDGSKSWYINGKRHREDGPAIELANGNKVWYIDDVRMNCSNQEEFDKLMRIKGFL